MREKQGEVHLRTGRGGNVLQGLIKEIYHILQLFLLPIANIRTSSRWIARAPHKEIDRPLEEEKLMHGVVHCLPRKIHDLFEGELKVTTRTTRMLKARDRTISRHFSKCADG